MRRERPKRKHLVPVVLGALILLAPAPAVALPSADLPRQAVQLSQASWDPQNAPKSKYIKKVTETTTTQNLHLRAKPNTTSKSQGVMRKGSVVKPTGKASGAWKELIRGSKRGWAHGKYLKTQTYTKDDSVRYLNGYTDIHETASMGRRVGAVNFRTQVSLLETKGLNSHIKTGSYHGWVPSSRLATRRPAVQYRYIQKSGSVYSHWDRAKSKHAGRVHIGEKYEFRRWVGSSGRDEIKVNGKWVWSDVTARAAVKYQYRYAQKDGLVYNSATASKSSSVGTIKAGTKVRWGARDTKSRRDEVLFNGKWVWTEVTGSAGPRPAFKDYGRFASRQLTLKKQASASSQSVAKAPKGVKVTVIGKVEGGWVRIKYGSTQGYVKEQANLQANGPYSVAVYGTLRTGQSAYNVMGAFQQKVMNQRIANTSLYQLWNPNWTFLTNGGKSVVAEQFQYTDTAGPSMLRKLDAYEGQLKYQGKPMYTRQKVTMSDGSQSWTYKTTDFSEKVVKKSGRYISSGDFLKRS